MIAKIRQLTLLALAALVSGVQLCAAQDADLIRRFEPALVLIHVRDAVGQRGFLGHGTGWLVSEDGFVITARHVITADNQFPWDQVTLTAYVEGHVYDAEVREVLSAHADVALLKLTMKGIEAGEVFERVHAGTLAVGTNLWILGFPRPDKFSPESLPTTVSRSAGVTFGGSRIIPDGFSGGPALLLTDEAYAAGVALLMLQDQRGRDIQSEYLAAGSLQPLFDIVSRESKPRAREPRWVPPPRPPELFRETELNEVVAALRNKKSVLVTGGPGMEIFDFVIEAGYRTFHAIPLRPADLLFVDLGSATTSSSSPSGSAFSEILMRLVRQLRLGYLEKAPDEQKREAVRKALERGPARMIILHRVADEEDLKRLLDLGASTAVLATADSVPLTARFDEVIRLHGLPLSGCLSLFKRESGLSVSTVAEGKAVRGICEALDGAPLPIRVAGALVRQWKLTAAQVHSKLHNQPLGDIPQIMAMYEVAYQRLASDRSRVLANLSVIGGDTFGIEAAESVSRKPDADVILRELVALNLVAEFGEGRYRMPMPIRQHAMRKASADEQSLRERDVAQRAMIRHFLQEFGGDLSDYEREWSNVLHALGTCEGLKPEADARQCLRLGVPRVAPFMRHWGQWDAHQTWVTQWREAARTDKDTRGERGALLALAEIEQERGQEEKARSLLAEASGLPEPEKDIETAAIFYHLALFDVKTARRATPPASEPLMRAQRLVKQGLAIADAAPDDPNSTRKFELLAAGYRDLGILAQLGGRYDEAREHLTESIRIASNKNLSKAILGSQYHLGILAGQEKRLDDATREFLDVYESARRGRFEESRAASATMLGKISAEQNRLEVAEQYLSEAAIIYERLRSPYLGNVRDELAKVQRRLKDRKPTPRSEAATPTADDREDTTPPK